MVESLQNKFCRNSTCSTNNGIHCGSITVVQDDNTIKVWGEILTVDTEQNPPIVGITPSVPLVPGSIVATDHAFAGIMIGTDKTGLAWGHKDYGGLVESEFACNLARDVEEIYAINDTFTALVFIGGKGVFRGQIALDQMDIRCHGRASY